MNELLSQILESQLTSAQLQELAGGQEKPSKGGVSNARLSHGRNAKSGTVNRARGNEAASEIIAIFPWLK